MMSVLKLVSMVMVMRSVLTIGCGATSRTAVVQASTTASDALFRVDSSNVWTAHPKLPPWDLGDEVRWLDREQQTVVARVHAWARAAAASARPRAARGARDLASASTRSSSGSPRPRTAGCGWRSSPTRCPTPAAGSRTPSPGWSEADLVAPRAVASPTVAASRRVLTDEGRRKLVEAAPTHVRGVREHLVDLASTRGLRRPRPDLRRGQRPAAHGQARATPTSADASAADRPRLSRGSAGGG